MNTPPPRNQSLSLSYISQKCSIKPWEVNFANLHWDKFILYPENGFTANQCSGKCHLQENHQINYVKLRQLNNGLKEKSCCVPTQFGNLPLMYFDKFENVVLKNFKDMVVEECGCR